ncbi:YDG domain-containing protein [Variovorax ginsengisoli]|uniref:Filamentous hemagglutinin family protein n=1 Tax=Variovorax ginsengisoli TaxID=363844 RepID=A0ABT9S3U2_9BURK|nr:YDG domain-containing protein [Variovorax ginsengisoli]MDP9898022.1 filamentous hemagglutinin family protein [Variovorax ginsengisoli]
MSTFRHGSFNRAFSLVWNEQSQAWVPAPEGSRARGKRGATAIAAAVLTTLAGSAYADGALPTGGTVTAGSAFIGQVGSAMTIRQASDKAVIDWKGFSIGAGNSVTFAQPSSASIVLNRVVGQDPTQILGTMQANGQVFLVNPNGVVFAQGAQVSTAGLVASTRDIATTDFMNGRFAFSGSGTGRVVNQGTLAAQSGGYVALIGAQVVNGGTIQAPGGDVRMAAADAVSLRIDGAGLTGFTVERGTLDGLAANQGLIQAAGGRIALTADAVDALSRAVVNHTGIIEAQSAEGRNGVVELRGDAAVGQVGVSGRIDVSSASGAGGVVGITGREVALEGTAAIDASGATGGGMVRVGGGWQGKDADLANASKVAMAPGATIDVSARQRGNGGTAVLWSQDYTAFSGSIAARGGASGGNGGKVETSSHDLLQALGRVDSTALAGLGGAWLLDPYNVTIASSGAAGTAYAANYSPTADSTILASSIASSLNAGTNVTITTGSSGTSAGNITVAAPITVSNNNYFVGPTLTLQAANDINVNAAITNSSTTPNNRLNVVLTPGNSGSVNFGATGSITTHGGNVYVGALSGTGTAETVSAQGNNLTMTAGSFIETNGGMLDARVNGSISLAAGSIRSDGSNSAYYTTAPTTGSQRGIAIHLAAAAIDSTNTSATTADIRTQVDTSLQAGSVGSSANPIKIGTAGAYDGYGRLTVSNSTGSSYVNEVGAYQSFATVAVNVGSQASATQDIRILGDFGGNGHDGTGHILVQNDANGVTALNTGDINTVGSGRATSVEVAGNTLTFADNAVKTGDGYFSASATTLKGAAAGNGVADIVSADIRLTGADVGAQSHPIELATTPGYNLPYYNYSSLTVSNTGGSTYLKVVDDSFNYINLSNVKDAGSHHILFSGGDHIDYSTDGGNVVLPTLSGGATDGSTFFATTGIDTTRSPTNPRYLGMTATSGGFVFDDNSVNLGAGSYSVVIPRSNATGTIAAQNTYNASAPVAQITAGDVSFNVQNDVTPGVTTIGDGGKDIQIAQGVGAAGNTLSVSTQQGNVNIHELTQNHFKSIQLNLGSASAAQTIAIDLAGADDINFSDSGSLVLVDPTKVAVSANNRNFSLSAYERNIETDGNALTTGSYSLSTGQLLKLNGDVRTDGGDISLSGSRGVDLMKSVRVDSNVGRLGAGGNINIGTDSSTPSYTVSSTGGQNTLTVDSSSIDNIGGNIGFSSNVDSRAGAFLAGLTLNAGGAAPTAAGVSNDGSVSIGSYSNNNASASSILLKGSFASTGLNYLASLYGQTIDTEQGNTGSAGNITFGGGEFSSNASYGALKFDASTTATAGNGGSVNLATRHDLGRTLLAGAMTVTATAGTGGTAGDITLGAVSTSNASYNGTGAGSQSYTGGAITLTDNLTTTNAAIGLNGSAIRIGAASVVIDTNSSNSGNSGSVTMSGALAGSVTGALLAIDTTSSSGSGGAVSLGQGAGNGGGHYLGGLNINTARGGSGTHGAINLSAAVATEGTQTYAGGVVSSTVGLSTNGGDIDLRSAAGIALTGTAGAAYTISTDRAGGSNDAGALSLGALALNGSYALSIDTTADGGGAGKALSLNATGATTAFASVSTASSNLVLNGTVRASGPVTMEARGATSNLTIANTGSVVTTNASDIVLAAGGNFTNNKGATGIVPGSGGRYFVYASDPSLSTEGMTGYSKHYNQTYTAGATPAYASSTGNWFLYAIAPVVSVVPNATSVVYGSADPSTALTAGNYHGLIDGDTLSSFGGSQALTLASAGTLSGAGLRQAGNYAYTLNGTLTDSLGYTYAPFAQSLTVTPRALALSGIAVSNKAYDGTTVATITGMASASAALPGDFVTVSGTGTGSFASANAGGNIAVTVGGYAIGGTDGGNYLASQPTGLQASITPKALTIAGSSVVAKTYDGGTSATIVAGNLNGLVGSETLGVSGSGTFADKNAGTAKNVTTAYTLANGTDNNAGLASNYSLAGQTLAGDIVAKTIAVTATGVNKTYDGSTSAAATLASAGIVGNDVVNFSGNATFADKNASTGKTVTVADMTAAGTDSGNYSIANATATTTADISAKAITVTATGVGKTYDGTTGATATLASTGVIGNDVVSFSGNASYADKNVGANKAVSVTGIGASGADALNYTVSSSSAATTASIVARTITVAATGVGKTYDGGTSATATLSSAGVVAGDTVSFGGSASFADKNAGTAKALNVTNIGKSGADAGNYLLSGTTAATTADIAAKVITVTATGLGKTYDGTTAATATLASNGVIGNDAVSFSGTATLADKNVGTGKAVSVANISADGADAGNYTFNTTAATTAAVTAKTITVAATGVGKTYDGTTAANANLASAGVVAGDAVNFSGTASYTDKNVGTGKTVNIAGISKSGGDAGNYLLTGTTAATTADIAAKAITVAASGVGKTYDGTTAASADLASAGVVVGDTVNFSGSASYADKNAGTGKTVNVADISKSGADAGNYLLTGTTAATSADIAAKAITVAATGVGKTYDGTTAAAATLASSGVVGNDVVNFDGTASYADKNAGTGKAVNVAGISKSGADAGNYLLSGTTATTTADIAVKAITVAATGVGKTYDGTTAATATLASSGVVGNDVVNFSGTASYADKNAGMGKTVNIAGIAKSGADAENYVLATTGASTTADIAAKVITVTATGLGKTYDGTTAATATLAGNGVIGNDAVSFSGTATLADKNVGTGKAVTVAGIASSGADAGNYTFNTTAATTADVAAKTINVDATGIGKTYDGTTAATANLASAGVIAGDTVNFSGTASYADKNVGTGKTVSIANIAASGTDAGNYMLANTGASTTADIAAKAIAVTASSAGKVYDSTTAVGVSLTPVGIIAGDTVTVAGAATLANGNAGTDKAVAVTGITLGGSDAGNYRADSTASTTATVAPRQLAVALQGPVAKSEDGNNTATLSSGNYVIAGLVGGDAISITHATGLYADGKVGSDKLVSTTLGAGDYQASGQTLLANYLPYVGPVSGAVGLVQDATTTSSGYRAAVSNAVTAALAIAPQASDVQLSLNSAAPLPEAAAQSQASGAQAERTIGEGGDASPPRQGTARRSEVTAVSSNSAENLIQRRTFSVADGGIRLPAGVRGSDRDASQ